MRDQSQNSNVIEIPLEQAFHYRPVNTKIYEPYVIARLMEHPARQGNSLDYEITLQTVEVAGTRTLGVRWTWTDAMISPTPLAAQREVITESAAYALSFALIPRCTSAELVNVADRNDRFDYVLSENGRLCGMEVSGSETENRQRLRDRQQQKIRQLLENPMHWNGYVVVVGFARREIILSYHEQGGGQL